MSPFAVPEETVLSLVNAAKAFRGAKTPERRTYWANRLDKRVDAYREAESEAKKRLKDVDASDKAAASGNWFTKLGALIPYDQLTDKHLDRILKMIERSYTSPQSHPHWDNLLAEVRRRAQAGNP